MDNFVDKLASKLSAQDMIRANNMAQEAENERTRLENEHYKQQMKDLQELTESTNRQLEEIKNSVGSMEETVGKLSDNTHETGVRVYRNVQAVVDNDKKEILDRCSEIYANLQADKTQMPEQMKNQLKEIGNNIEAMHVSVDSKNSAAIPLLVIVLIVSGADLVINILRILGIL